MTGSRPVTCGVASPLTAGNSCASSDLSYRHPPFTRSRAGAARGRGRPVAKAAVVSLERGEHHAALARLVAVVQ